MGNSPSGGSGRDAVKTGDVIEGRYRIIRTLGEGGMGTVFLAEHTLIKRRVAIKILHTELATDADVIERFMNEARAAGTLGHPNIVESTDMGFCNGHVPYIVFEYLEGTLLTDEVYRVGGLPLRRTVRIAQQIASALHAAHHAGIVHRDLKSDNVFLTDKDDALDHVKVLDFGISRFLELDEKDSHRGMVMGTPEFMSPEAITDPARVDHRADIYALGVILYEMVTARRPFSNDEDPRALMHRIVHNAPPPLQRPEVPHALGEMILNKMLAKNPDDRYQSMLDVEAALDAFVTNDGAKAKRRSRPMPIPAPPEENDVARRSDLIPRPVMAATPWPKKGDDTSDALSTVALPQHAPARKPYVLYGMAAMGLVLGAGGLLFGLRNSNDQKVARSTPVTTPAPAPAPLPAAATTPAPTEVAPAKVAVALNANVPNARVTFRRRVSAAPSTMQITPSDIVELVEVSAPGYKTVRYWLTFDRPTTLNAKLTKGSGMEEATEEATLIALGELAAPTPKPAPVEVAAAKAVEVQETKVATEPRVEAKEAKVAKEARVAKEAKETNETKVAMVDKTVAQPDAKKPTPRKIGRGTEPMVETAAANDASDTPAAPVAEPTPAPKAEPIVDATKPEPVAEPVTPAPKTEPKTEPKPEPKVEAAVAKPTIDKGVVTSIIGQHRPEVLKCFAEGKKKNSAMKGTLNLQLQVDATGKVRAQVQSTLNAPLVAACVIRAASTWKFPARAGADVASVVYPFTIN
ncbi:MAG: protein kinase [Kofleriaceae bacterium]